MKLNRRSVLGAIGLAGVGTGAAFGSGAFTSTTAERAVEVNVFGDNGIVTNTDDEEAIADAITANIADVLVDTSSDTVTVRERTDGTGNTRDGVDLFPTVDLSFDGNYSQDELDNNYVSLVANDVTIVFGDESSGLPSNSTVTFSDLFAFVPNDTGGYSVNFDGGEDGYLTSPSGGVFSGNSFDQSDAEVSTQQGTEGPESLSITIEQSSE